MGNRPTCRVRAAKTPGTFVIHNKGPLRMNAMCNVPTPEALLQAGQQVSDNRLKIPPCGKLDLQLDSWWACHSGHQHSRPSTSREPRAAMAAAAYFCSRTCLHILFSSEPFEDPVSLPPFQVRKRRPRGCTNLAR